MQIATPSAAVSLPPRQRSGNGAGELAVVLVHHRRTADAAASLASLQEHAPDVPVVFVDCVGEALPPALSAACSGVRCDPLTSSFAIGANLGLQHALGAHAGVLHVLLLHSDVRLRCGALSALRTCAQHHGRAGVIGCRVLAAGGSPFVAAPLPAALRTLEPVSPGATEFEAEQLDGTCCLLDVALVRRGLRFDPAFAWRGAIVDLLQRCRQLGRSVWTTRAATVEDHAPAADATLAEQFATCRAQAALVKKHRGRLRTVVFAAAALLAQPALDLLRRRRFRALGARLLGTLAGLLHKTSRP